MAGVSAFKETDEAREARELERQKRIEEEQAKKLAEEKAKASYTSIADSAQTHKSAFFSRAQSNRPAASVNDEEHTSAYGGMLRPAGADKDRENKSNTPAMGAALEGQRPSIMDPNVHAAPTASKPLAGFKSISGEDDKDEPSEDSPEDKV